MKANDQNPIVRNRLKYWSDITDNNIDNDIPEVPCGYGEGDCDGPGDGGGNDGHAGCQKGLVCGSNNCRKFGLYYHEKDDCCDVPDALQSTTESNSFGFGNAPLEPKPGEQRKAHKFYLPELSFKHSVHSYFLRVALNTLSLISFKSS